MAYYFFPVCSFSYLGLDLQRAQARQAAPGTLAYHRNKKIVFLYEFHLVLPCLVLLPLMPWHLVAADGIPRGEQTLSLVVLITIIIDLIWKTVKKCDGDNNIYTCIVLLWKRKVMMPSHVMHIIQHFLAFLGSILIKQHALPGQEQDRTQKKSPEIFLFNFFCFPEKKIWKKF